MQHILRRRLVGWGAIAVAAGSLTACLPSGGDPPPPWCHPTGIRILEASLASAQQVGAERTAATIEWKLAQCQPASTTTTTEATTTTTEATTTTTEAPTTTTEAPTTTTEAPTTTSTSTTIAQLAICHKAGSKYQLTMIDPPSLPAHQAHGDIYPVPAGGCP